MSRNIIYVTSKEFAMLSKLKGYDTLNLNFTILDYDDKISFVRNDAPLMIDDKPKAKMTRREAILLFEKHMPYVSNADKVVDFYIEAGMLEIEQPKITDTESYRKGYYEGFLDGAKAKDEHRIIIMGYELGKIMEIIKDYERRKNAV